MAGLDAGDRLAAFLRLEAARGFDWGRANCLLLPADWAVALGLSDPAAKWRTACADEAAARALVDAAGGIQALACQAMAEAGWSIVAHAVRGDVGVVRVTGPDGPAQVGAICTGRRWAARGRRGLWIGRAGALCAWRMEAGEHV